MRTTKTTEAVSKTHAIRQRNLRALYEDGKFSNAIFGALGWNYGPSQISQYAHGHRNIGENVARKIETALGLQRGTLDIPSSPLHSAPQLHALRDGSVFRSPAQVHEGRVEYYDAGVPPREEPAPATATFYENAMRVLFAALSKMPEGTRTREAMIPDAVIILSKVARGNGGAIDPEDAMRVAKMLVIEIKATA